MSEQPEQLDEQPDRWAVVDDDGLVVNVVAWNGTDPWPTPPGTQLVPDLDRRAEPGGRRTAAGQLERRPELPDHVRGR